MKKFSKLISVQIKIAAFFYFWFSIGNKSFNFLTWGDETVKIFAALSCFVSFLLTAFILIDKEINH
jgi:hypothetical protein